MFAKHRRRDTRLRAEEAREVVGILKSQTESDIVHTHVSTSQQHLAPLDDFLLYKSLCSHAKLPAQSVAEMPRAKIELFGTPCHRRLSALPWERTAWSKVIVDERLQARYELRSANLTSVKLPLIKPLTAGQHRPYAQTEHVARIFVVRSLQLSLDVEEAVEGYPAFGLTKFKSLSNLEVKEIEHIEVTLQARAVEQLWTEDQHPALRLDARRETERNHITRLHRKDSSRVIVHSLAMQLQLPETRVHQHDAVHSEIQRQEQRRIGVGKVSDTDERMICRLMEIRVELTDAFYPFVRHRHIISIQMYRFFFKKAYFGRQYW